MKVFEPTAPGVSLAFLQHGGLGERVSTINEGSIEAFQPPLWLFGILFKRGTGWKGFRIALTIENRQRFLIDLSAGAKDAQIHLKAAREALANNAHDIPLAKDEKDMDIPLVVVFGHDT